MMIFENTAFAFEVDLHYMQFNVRHIEHRHIISGTYKIKTSEVLRARVTHSSKLHRSPLVEYKMII